MGELPNVVNEVTAAYLDVADERLPGRLVGLHLTGSVAYRDFWPNSSDIDFVAVTRERLSKGGTAAVQAMHQEIARRFRRPHFDGLYATPGDLRTHPDDVPQLHAVHEGTVIGKKPDVITWGTLRQSLPVRGQALRDAWCDPQVIKDYSRRNLSEYWRDHWLRSQKGLSPKAAVSLS